MDLALWQHISQGDREAYSEIYVFYYKRLYNYGKKFTDSESQIEDAIQEIFVHFWQNRENIPHIKNPQSYLFYSFRNILFLRIKRDRRLTSLEQDQKPDEPVFHAEHFLIQEEVDASRREQLRQAIEQLPGRQREIIFLRFYEAIPYEQIAEIMQISVPSTYKTVSKALFKLRNTLEIPLILVFLLLKNN